MVEQRRAPPGPHGRHLGDADVARLRNKVGGVDVRKERTSVSRESWGLGRLCWQVSQRVSLAPGLWDKSFAGESRDCRMLGAVCCQVRGASQVGRPQMALGTFSVA